MPVGAHCVREREDSSASPTSIALLAVSLCFCSAGCAAPVDSKDPAGAGTAEPSTTTASPEPALVDETAATEQDSEPEVSATEQISESEQVSEPEQSATVDPVGSGVPSPPQVSLEAPELSSGPKPVPDACKAARVVNGASHHCAITRGGQLYCWGANYYHQLGYEGGPQECPVVGGGTKPCNPSPELVAGLNDVVHVALEQQSA